VIARTGPYRAAPRPRMQRRVIITTLLVMDRSFGRVTTWVDWKRGWKGPWGGKAREPSHCRQNSGPEIAERRPGRRSVNSLGPAFPDSGHHVSGETIAGCFRHDYAHALLDCRAVRRPGRPRGGRRPRRTREDRGGLSLYTAWPPAAGRTTNEYLPWSKCSLDHVRQHGSAGRNSCRSATFRRGCASECWRSCSPLGPCLLRTLVRKFAFLLVAQLLINVEGMAPCRDPGGSADSSRHRPLRRPPKRNRVSRAGRDGGG
jgi:hypothetical protein